MENRFSLSLSLSLYFQWQVIADYAVVAFVESEKVKKMYGKTERMICRECRSEGDQKITQPFVLFHRAL